MEQLLRPPILEGNEIELRPSGEVLTRRCSQPIEYLDRAWIKSMSNKPDDSHGFFMERLLKLCPRIFEGSEIDLRPCGELLTLCSSLVQIGCSSQLQGLPYFLPVLSPSVLIEEAEVGERIIKFETGFIATRTKGSVILKDGGMVILATICSRRKANQPFKLMGDYREDPSARCEMPTWLGRCYVSPWERLCGSLIYRALTPLIRPHMGMTVQMVDDEKNHGSMLCHMDGTTVRPSGVLQNNSSLKLTSSRYFKKQKLRLSSLDNIRCNSIGSYAVFCPFRCQVPRKYFHQTALNILNVCHQPLVNL
ncbi:hypothetical protein DY000_02010175 [Brassica cretica]|uniref:Uncharacterized protein n=1 Tax=Brassica cretica TaxID=69181 RepID=A0ABQ7CH95_BRACR|nr:hypothetical protein DY000_02010175 [Brassica cretica]